MARGAALGGCVDAWEDCFSFFHGKSPYHTTRHSLISHFSRNQKVAWKLSCALVVFLFSVFFPSLTLSWEGFTADGIEKTPPLMLFGPATALFAVLALWVAAVHTYQPTFNGPRILVHYRRPAPCSWEMLDWVFFEGATTATVVAFVYFWIVTLPYSNIQLKSVHIVSIVVLFVVVMVDFYFTAPMFRANHVFLALLWPAFWLFVQYLWVLGGHQPGNNLFNFHTPSAIFSALLLLAGTVVAFFALRWYAARLQWLSDQGAKGSSASAPSVASHEHSGLATPSCEDDSAAQFELMVDATRAHSDSLARSPASKHR